MIKYKVKSLGPNDDGENPECLHMLNLLSNTLNMYSYLYIKE